MDVISFKITRFFSKDGNIRKVVVLGGYKQLDIRGKTEYEMNFNCNTAMKESLSTKNKYDLADKIVKFSTNCLEFSV